jgi:hypothetical protein
MPLERCQQRISQNRENVCIGQAGLQPRTVNLKNEKSGNKMAGRWAPADSGNPIQRQRQSASAGHRLAIGQAAF